MEAELLQHVTDELKADPIAWPILDKMSEKDIPSVLKSYAHSQHRLGTAIPLPAKDAKPEEVQAVRKRIYDAGLFPAPPADPKEYQITTPESLPEGLGWNDELAGKFGTLLYKHGASKELAKDLLELYGEALGGAQNTLNLSYEDGITALKAEHGDKYDERKELAKRLAGQIFKSEEELAFFENTNLGNHPAFLSILMRLAPLAQQDSSYIKDLDHGDATGGMTGDDVRAEVAKIMGDKNHPMYAGYWRADKKVLDHIDELYRKAYGTGKVEIT